MIKAASADPASNQTHSRIMGVSRVENDPDNREFDFYIASEAEHIDGLVSFDIREGEWAIFEGDGDNRPRKVDETAQHRIGGHF